jgi:phage shock protein C
MKKRLYRSDKNKILAGIFGGLGDYFGVDPVILRVVYIFIAVFTAFIPGIIVYLFAIVIVPRKPRDSK